jgi:hypothetical protein
VDGRPLRSRGYGPLMPRAPRPCRPRWPA